jgi:hypothetical protein
MPSEAASDIVQGGAQPTQSWAALPSLDSQPMICGMIARLLPTQQKENLVAFKCDIWG